MSEIRISLGHEYVGKIVFTQLDRTLKADRTAFGFRVHLPATLTFAPPENGVALLLENLKLTLSTIDRGKPIEIGTAACDSSYTTAMQGAALVIFQWDWSMPVLAFYENLRDGREPSFNISISGDVRYLLPGPMGKQPCSIAHTFHDIGQLDFSREAWVTVLRELNMRDAVIVEIPFRTDPPSAWEPVWQALLDARASFEAGGASGWKNCVTGVRLALEEWQKVEKEDQGLGWQRPSLADLQSRTKSQRIDNLRWHLIQCAHLAAHTNADDWTRDDAVLALSTLSALLAVRKP